MLIQIKVRLRRIALNRSFEANSGISEIHLTTKATGFACDTYSDSIREASVLFIMTGPPTGHWKVDWCPLHRTVLQFGADGGPRVVHGITKPDATTIMLQSIKVPHKVVFDGQKLKNHDVAVLAPGAHFTFAAKASTHWIAFSVPPELVPDPPSAKALGISFRTQNVAVTLTPALAARLTTAAKQAQESAEDIGGPQYATDILAIETALLKILNDVLSDPLSEIKRPGRNLESLNVKMSRALECVRSKATVSIQVGDLAAATGISTRTLHRCFQAYLQMGPKEYLKYRRLNQVRRALRLEDSSGNQVTRIMSRYGVTEFGRFAAAYRELFQELPSDTYRRRKEEEARPDNSEDAISFAGVRH
jgi:AraC family transcriptional regulator, ethanolamine operon transcriptional activator